MNKYGGRNQAFFIVESFTRSQLIKRTCINPLNHNGDQH